MLCTVYTSIAGEYDGPPFCTPIGKYRHQLSPSPSFFSSSNPTCIFIDVIMPSSRVPVVPRRFASASAIILHPSHQSRHSNIIL